MECIVTLPYPEIMVEKENIYYAQIILNLYSGIISEYTAVNQYVYDFLNEFNQDLAQDLKKISMVEMHHLKILGKTLKLLGINPKYKYIDDKNVLKNWQTNFISYINDTKEMLKYNIILEEKTIKDYEAAYKIIKDSYIRKNIARILLDEKKHVACFKAWLHEFTCSP